ncbi:MAG: hypothetical protein QOJ29_3698 [Thermoleophilaceae bacterium]|nr:hypothetical protein [Thermoleophilaceae bacterium]
MLALAVAFAGVAAPAHSDDPVPTQKLPDLRETVPSDVKMTLAGGGWRLGFASEVVNDGPGYLKITGNGLGAGPMTAEQIVEMSDGTSTSVASVGEMHYVIGGGHEHWHLLDFERYELRSAADPGLAIVTDQKTGYCLADAFTTDLCGRDHPELTTVSEGIGVTGSDKYVGYLEGQYLVLDPQTVPDGDYLLVNRVNPTGALLEADSSNDAASVRLAVTWDANSRPTIKVTNSCPASIDCPAPPAPPLPDPQPTPNTQNPAGPSEPTAPAPAAVVPAPEPETVPEVPPTDFAPVATVARASMSRSMAGRLVRRAIVKSLKLTPRSLQLSCNRSGRAGFRCSADFQELTARRWQSKVRVWYRLRDGKLSWFYNLTARRRPDGKYVTTQEEQGSASRAVFAGPAGSLFCARVS